MNNTSLKHHDFEKLYNSTLSLATEKKCLFIEELVSYLPICRTTFYDYFKLNSTELDNIKDILDSNKVSLKTQMYSKWFKSDAPALQIALMKLIATDSEAHRLNGSRQEGKKVEDKEIVITLVNPKTMILIN